MFKSALQITPWGRLYRCRRYDANELRLLLTSGQVRFSNPVRFNDCAPQLFAPRQIQLISRSSIRRRSAPSNIHDAVHPAPISRAQRHPPPVDGGIPASRPSPICPADPGLQDPGCCAVYLDCNVLPNLSGLSADATPIAGSANPSTPDGSCRSPVHKSRWLSGSAVVISVHSRRAPRSTHSVASRICGLDRESGIGACHRTQ